MKSLLIATKSCRIYSFVLIIGGTITPGSVRLQNYMSVLGVHVRIHVNVHVHVYVHVHLHPLSCLRPRPPAHTCGSPCPHLNVSAVIKK
jgi:hypothetical protein